ncbi:MAG: nucleoside deaminase [Candidatus Methylacidiphilales bacterium]|nr:nucleoside deaminase [Candidatus Methylacidiphilales bacterium]
MKHLFLQAAIEEAKKGRDAGGIPIGSVLVYRDKIIGRGHNQRVQQGDPILHAEIHCLQNAGRQPAAVYRECLLVSTLSPCPLCSGAARLFKIPRVLVGENITFRGPEEENRAHGMEIEVVQDEECIRLMREFIQEKPELWNEDIAV